MDWCVGGSEERNYVGTDIEANAISQNRLKRFRNYHIFIILTPLFQKGDFHFPQSWFAASIFKQIRPKMFRNNSKRLQWLQTSGGIHASITLPAKEETISIFFCCRHTVNPYICAFWQQLDSSDWYVYVYNLVLQFDKYTIREMIYVHAKCGLYQYINV